MHLSYFNFIYERSLVASYHLLDPSRSLYMHPSSQVSTRTHTHETRFHRTHFNSWDNNNSIFICERTRQRIHQQHFGLEFDGSHNLFPQTFESRFQCAHCSRRAAHDCTRNMRRGKKPSQHSLLQVGAHRHNRLTIAALRMESNKLQNRSMQHVRPPKTRRTTKGKHPALKHTAQHTQHTTSVVHV